MKNDPALVVVGGGSAGVAAALSAARRGIPVVLLEKERILGGTSTLGGVNCWEPVCCDDAVSRAIFHRLAAMPEAVGIYRIHRHAYFCSGEKSRYPGCEQQLVPGGCYEDTIRANSGGSAAEAALRSCGVIFEPAAWDRAVRQLLRETGCCTVLSGVAVADFAVAAGRITGCRLSDGREIRSTLWVDCCGAAATAAGCRVYFGEDPRSRFGEPDAPERSTGRRNGVSLIFRVQPAATPGIGPLPGDWSGGCDWSAAFPPLVTTVYPNGDLNCNMLPTMTGQEFALYGEKVAYRECQRRVRLYWHYLQSVYPEFQHFRLRSCFSRLGIRDSFRVDCDYMLREQDLLNGGTAADCIGWCDHPMDIHGDAPELPRIQRSYGIPYGSLLPRGTVNLLLAGKNGGFSSLAASSCRLSRTMIQLGSAAGIAAALAATERCEVREVDPAAVRAALFTANRREGTTAVEKRGADQSGEGRPAISNINPITPGLRLPPEVRRVNQGELT